MDKEPLDSALGQATLVDNLINANLVSPKEIESANSQQIDHLAARAQEILTRPGTDFDQRGKIESILDIGKGKRKSKLELTARVAIFAIYLHLKYPNHISGVVFFGSQKKGSDLDSFIFTQPGIELPALEMPFGFEKAIEKAEKRILGAPIDGHFFLEKLDKMTPEEAQSNYPEIAQGAIAIFTDRGLGKKFKDVFGPQMNKPQNFSKTPITKLVRY